MCSEKSSGKVRRASNQRRIENNQLNLLWPFLIAMRDSDTRRLPAGWANSSLLMCRCSFPCRCSRSLYIYSTLKISPPKSICIIGLLNRLVDHHWSQREQEPTEGRCLPLCSSVDIWRLANLSSWFKVWFCCFVSTVSTGYDMAAAVAGLYGLGEEHSRYTRFQ